jgi:hypothetical protein
MIPGYERMFAERGGITPSDPLGFHLYHLARYWNRLVGICRQAPSKPEVWIDGGTKTGKVAGDLCRLRMRSSEQRPARGFCRPGPGI